MESRVAAAVYEFGPFVLDLRTFELRRRGCVVHMEPLSQDFLAYLIHHRERVIPTPELLAELWPGTCVTRGVLARTAHRTRDALGDDASHPIWIATLRGRGYRFVGDVREQGLDPDPVSILELEPPPVESYRALAQLGRDRYVRALELLDAGELLPLRRELLLGLGQVLRAIGEADAGVRVLRQAARLSPRPPTRRSGGTAAR